MEKNDFERGILDPEQRVAAAPSAPDDPASPAEADDSDTDVCTDTTCQDPEHGHPSAEVPLD